MYGQEHLITTAQTLANDYSATDIKVSFRYRGRNWRRISIQRTNYILFHYLHLLDSELLFLKIHLFFIQFSPTGAVKVSLDIPQGHIEQSLMQTTAFLIKAPINRHCQSEMKNRKTLQVLHKINPSHLGTHRDSCELNFQNKLRI